MANNSTLETSESLEEAARPAPLAGKLAPTPTDLDAYAQWAWLSGRVDEAIELYTDIANVYRHFPHVHFKLGFLFLASRDFVSAVRHFSIQIDRYAAEAAVLAPEQKPEAQDPRARRLSSCRVLPTPTSVNPQRPFMLCAHFGRQEAYLALGDQTQAEKDALHIASRGGTTQPGLVSMSVLFCHFGMLQRAEQCLDQCLEMDVKDPEYLIAHGDLCLAQKRYATAAKSFEKCRSASSAVSVAYYRALVGQGSALLRNHQLQEAAVLLQQAITSLRSSIRKSGGNPTDTLCSPDTSGRPRERNLAELTYLYHQATNLHGGLCLMLGDLRGALDILAVVVPPSDPSGQSKQDIPFLLPTICVLPGTKDEQGELVDSIKLSPKNLGEVIRHLSEMEWRYGPDPCLYFHRAQVYRALGDLSQFVHNLSLVEAMDPDFMKIYLQCDCLGDFLDVETVSWLPLRFVEALHMSLERREYKIPAPSAESSSSTFTVSTPTSRKSSRAPTTPRKQNEEPSNQPSFCEASMFTYFQARLKFRKTSDEYAQVFQLDVFRRLPEAKRRRINGINNTSSGTDLAEWEGMHLDLKESVAASRDATKSQDDNSARVLVKKVSLTHGKHPCVHMIGGIIELELCSPQLAHLHFTEALSLIAKRMSGPPLRGPAAAATPLAQRWQQDLMVRVKYHCLVWRSMANRMKIEMDEAVEDLNVAAAIKLSPKQYGSDDPLMLSQRSLILLLNGHLKSAHKMLRQLHHVVKVTRQQEKRNTSATSTVLPAYAKEPVDLMDLFANVGLNSFRLLPPKLEREFRRFSSATPSGKTGDRKSSSTRVGSPERAHATSDSVQDPEGDADPDAKEDEERAIAIVKYTVGKKAATNGALGSAALQTETLDKFYESGLLKLASTGCIDQATPYFHAILIMDESYLPPTNFASHELYKCKEQDYAEEKLYNCFVRLGKRTRWLDKKVNWPFEALVDANLAYAYLPSDMDTLWHRARLLQQQHNYSAAISDISGCLELISTHMMWKKGRKGHGKKAVFVNEMKKPQWLQLLLERGQLHMETENWEDAIHDLTMVITQVGNGSKSLEACAYEARSSCLIRLRRLGHAIQDLQQLVALNKAAHKKTSSQESSEGKTSEQNSTTEDNENQALNCILIGNLYCQLALDKSTLNANISQKMTAAPVVLEQLKAIQSTTGLISQAAAFYNEALAFCPNHFLAHHFRGRMYAISAQPRQAIESFSECLRHQPTFLPALFLRGSIYAQQHLSVLALADFYRVRHRAPSYPHLHSSIGYCHFQRDDMKKAVASLTDALADNSVDVDALYMRGCALQELFILSNAEQDFTRVLEIVPDHVRARYQRSVCLVLRQNYVLAIEDLAIAIKQQPEWSEAWLLHAYACFYQNRFDEAAFSYGHTIGLCDGKVSGGNRGVGKSTDSPSSLFLFRAFAHMHAADLPAALMDLELAVKRDNENFVAFLAMAFVLRQLGQKTRAMKVLAHALPHHKEMNLHPAVDPKEAEQAKVQQRNQGMENAPNGVVNPFMGGSLQTPTMRCPTKKSSIAQTPVAAVTCDAIFQYRRDSRGDQVERHVESVQRHVLDARTLTRQPRYPAASTALSEVGNGPTNQESQMRATREKFTRVIKKMTFEYRVLKALKSSANHNLKKNEKRARELAAILQPESKIPPPKGALTANILVWAFNLLGSHHVVNRNVDQALIAFTLATQAHPLAAITCFNRANVYLHMDVLSSAISGFHDALEADEKYFRAHNNMGVAFFQMKRLDEAQDAFSAGLPHASDKKHRAVLLYNLGVVAQVLEKEEEAIDLYQQAIALDATRSEFFNNRSSILHQQMKFSVALDDYNRALALGEPFSLMHESQGIDPLVAGNSGKLDQIHSCIEAHLNRAQLLITLGHCTPATKDLKIALRVLLQLRERRATSDSSSDRAAAAAKALAQSSDVTCSDTANKSCGADEEDLATELLIFCEKWQDAMQIAVKDFLFALETIPCFGELQLLLVFEDLLSQSRDDKAAQREDLASCGDRVTMALTLPISDASYFDFTRDLSDWAYGLESKERVNNNEPEEMEPDDPEDAFQKFLLTQNFAGDLRSATENCRFGDYAAAEHCLLRAHYKAPKETHAEYFIMMWRVQVVANLNAVDEEDKCHSGDHSRNNADEDDTSIENDINAAKPLSIARAAEMLQSFLADRQLPEELRAYSSDPSRISAATVSPGVSLMPLEDDDDEDEISEHDLKWSQQLRHIRADAYTYLGYLHQLNARPQQAHRAFAQALYLRDDNLIALLNYVQTSIILKEYEATLGSILRILEISIACAANDGTDTGKSKHQVSKGLMDADRSLHVVFPAARECLTGLRVQELAQQMLGIMTDYRGMLNASIQSNTPHIFRKQGALARLVQEMREVVGSQAIDENTGSPSLGETDGNLRDSLLPELKLDEFNRLLDDHCTRLLSASDDLADQASFEAFSSDFEMQFSRLCEHISQSLGIDPVRTTACDTDDDQPEEHAMSDEALLETQEHHAAPIQGDVSDNLPLSPGNAGPVEKRDSKTARLQRSKTTSSSALRRRKLQSSGSTPSHLAAGSRPQAPVRPSENVGEQVPLQPRPPPPDAHQGQQRRHTKSEFRDASQF